MLCCGNFLGDLRLHTYNREMWAKFGRLPETSGELAGMLFASFHYQKTYDSKYKNRQVIVNRVFFVNIDATFKILERTITRELYRNIRSFRYTAPSDCSQTLPVLQTMLNKMPSRTCCYPQPNSTPMPYLKNDHGNWLY